MKPSRPQFILILIAGFGLTLTYSNCSAPRRFSEIVPISKNTIAGNPMVAEKLARGICEKIRQCNSSVNLDQCSVNVMATGGFDKPLRLATEFSTLNAISQAQTSGVVVSSSESLNNCLQSVTEVTCSDPAATAAYRPSDPSPYAGAANLLSAIACSQTVAPVSQYTCSTQVFLNGVSGIKYAPPASPSNQITYSISPALPSGLNLDPATGIISGLPTVSSPMASYTVTAKNSVESVSSVLKIQTSDGYLVNDLGDEPNLGGTNCLTASGRCTLRAAIQAANSSTTRKAILVPAGTIGLTSGSRMIISRGMDVYGDCEMKTVLDGLGRTAVMGVTAGPTTLDHLVIQNGATKDEAGAGLQIWSDTATFTTNLNHFSARNNQNSGGSSGMSIGAGVAAFGKSSSVQAIVKLNDCEISNNVNENGNFGAGLGFWYNTQVSISNCLITGNRTTSYGGGISSHSGALNITDSVFTANIAAGEGGAIFTDQYSASNPNVDKSIFTANEAAMGGAIYVGANTLTVSNSRFENNKSDQWYGGALAGMPSRINIAANIFRNNTSNGVKAHCISSGNLPVVSGGGNNSDNGTNDCNLTDPTDLVNQ